MAGRRYKRRCKRKRAPIDFQVAINTTQPPIPLNLSPRSTMQSHELVKGTTWL